MMEKREPYTVWALRTTYTKKGFPVMGTVGASVRDVIVMEVATFRRLVVEHPSLETAEFLVGSLE